MENIEIQPRGMSQEEKDHQAWEKKWREMRIARTRAGVLRSQIFSAYEILENIRFDYLSDTAFRDKIVRAKINLESATDDFLLSDRYWEDKIKEHKDKTAEEYREEQENLKCAESSPSV